MSHARCTRLARATGALGACFASEEGGEIQALLTSSDGVATIECRTQVHQRRFPVRSRRHRLACACVQGARRRFSCMRGTQGDVLLSWSDEQEHLDGGKDGGGLQLREGKVVSLHILGMERQWVFVTMESGNVLAWDGENHLIEIPSPFQGRMMACLSSEMDGGRVMVAHQSLSDRATVKVDTYELAQGVKELRIIESIQLDIREERILVACERRGKTLCLLFEDGALQVFQCSDLPNENPKLQLQIMMRKEEAGEKCLPNGLPTKSPVLKRRRHTEAQGLDGDARSTFCLSMIGESYAAVAGLKKGGHPKVDFVDLKYGCRLASCLLSSDEDNTSNNAEVEVKHMVLNSQARDMLVVTGQQTFYLVEFDLPEPTLASVVGTLSLSSARQKPHHAGASPMGESLEASSAPLEISVKPVWCGGGSKSSRMGPNSHENHNDLDGEAADDWIHRADCLWDAEASSKTGMDLFGVERLLLDTASKCEEKDLTNALGLLFSSKRREPHLSQLLSLAIERCLDEGYWECSRRIIMSNALGCTRHCPRLIPTILEDEKIEMLVQFLDTAPELSAEEITSILQTFLDEKSHTETLKLGILSVDKTIKRKISQQNMEKEHLKAYQECKQIFLGNIFRSTELCLNSLLLHQIDRTVLLVALKRLSADVVTALLVYISKWHIMYSIHLSNDLPSVAKKMGLRVPTHSQCICWLTALLDCHLVQLKLSPHIQGVLKVLKMATDYSIQGCRPYLSMAGMVRQSILHASAPTEKSQDPQELQVDYLEFA